MHQHIHRNHTDKDDGMFWMSINDFARSFTEITFCDIVPDSFTILRAEGAWTDQTAGGCANHRSWCAQSESCCGKSHRYYAMLNVSFS